MPSFRPDLSAINPYVPGKPIEEVAREVGIDPSTIVKMASNESPDGPFPGVIEAAVGSLAESNRYPDNDFYELRSVLAAQIGVSKEHLLVGPGSTGLIMAIAIACGGPTTTALYAWPSFVMYRIVTKIAGSRPIEVQLDSAMKHDLVSMKEAVAPDTSVVYVCNPNNPTGTSVSADAVVAMIDSMPESVLVVVDEAYHHYVDDPEYRSLIPLAAETANVVVLRTFSKIYGLATHRVGVAVGVPSTLSELGKTLPPFSVSQVAQVAAMASLGDEAELARRVRANSEGRELLMDALAKRNIEYVPSQTNFVFARPGHSEGEFASEMTRHGVIIRPMSRGWVRVTVGTPEENSRFIEALDLVLP